MVIRIRLPRFSAGALSNLVGVLGLVAVALAVGGLTGNWWWSVLVGGVFAVGLAYAAAIGAESVEQPMKLDRPRSVKAA
jgi:peptidoglycan/LPS O-acetylase OafA/YrhL